MDQKEKEDLISTVLEDLHFWMNPQLFKEMKEREMSERENVLFEKQVEEMDSGNFKDKELNYWELMN